MILCEWAALRKQGSNQKHQVSIPKKCCFLLFLFLNIFFSLFVRVLFIIFCFIFNMQLVSKIRVQKLVLLRVDEYLLCALKQSSFCICCIWGCSSPGVVRATSCFTKMLICLPHSFSNEYAVEISRGLWFVGMTSLLCKLRK